MSRHKHLWLSCICKSRYVYQRLGILVYNQIRSIDIRINNVLQRKLGVMRKCSLLKFLRKYICS